MERKRYLFVTYKMSDGGAERVISNISKGLVLQGNEAAIFIYKRTDNEYDIHSNVEVFSMGDNYSEEKHNSCRRMFQRIFSLRKILKQYKPDYVIPFLSAMVYESFLATIGFNTTLIATIRNKPQPNSKIKDILSKIAFEGCSAIWLQTEKQRSYINKSMENKAFVISNPVSDELLLKGEKHIYRNSIKTVITCGRLCEQKNHLLLIEAMSIVHRQYPNIVLKIWGEGTVDYKKMLQKNINDINANDYILLMGRTNNIVEALDEADLFVLSSDYEGLPNALMEAMAVGIPCISTNCPTGPQDLLGDNERGIIVPMKESESLANAIIQMCTNTQNAKEYGRKGHKYILEKFNLECITKSLIKYCKLYER